MQSEQVVSAICPGPSRCIQIHSRQTCRTTSDILLGFASLRRALQYELYVLQVGCVKDCVDAVFAIQEERVKCEVCILLRVSYRQ